MERKNLLRNILICFTAALIPALLFLNTVQVRKSEKLRAQVANLEKKQAELVEENRKLITEISILSSSDRIESLAEKEFGMHKAHSEEIVRVEIKGGKK